VPQPDDNDNRRCSRAATLVAATAEGSAAEQRGRGGVRPTDVPQRCIGAPRSPPQSRAHTQEQRNHALGSGSDGAGGVDWGAWPNVPARLTRTVVLTADPGGDQQGESLYCWLTMTTTRIRGICGASYKVIARDRDRSPQGRRELQQKRRRLGQDLEPRCLMPCKRGMMHIMWSMSCNEPLGWYI
jgi:hypothetical protein